MSCKCTPPVTRTHKQTAGVNETNTDRETSPNAHQSKRGSKALPSCMKERMFNFNHQGQKNFDQLLWPCSFHIQIQLNPKVGHIRQFNSWLYHSMKSETWSVPFPHHRGEALPAQQWAASQRRSRTTSLGSRDKRARELKPKQSH